MPSSVIVPACAQHEPEHLPTRRAERHPHADLARPLRDEVRHHAVQPRRRQHQRHDRERATRARSSSAARDRIADQSSIGRDEAERQLRIDARPRLRG